MSLTRAQVDEASAAPATCCTIVRHDLAVRVYRATFDHLATPEGKRDLDHVERLNLIAAFALHDLHALIERGRQ